MKVFVIANANSEWIYNFVSLFWKSDIEISIWSPYRIEQSYFERYKESGICILECSEYIHNYLDKRKHSIIEKVLFLLVLIREIRRVSRKRNWDIMNIQYVDPHFLRVFAIFPAVTKKLVLSYWGSDLMREDASVLRSVTRVVNNSCGSTFDNGDLEQIHTRLYPDYNRRLIIMLPLPILDDIDRNIDLKRCEYIQVDGQRIDRSKITVCIGYNGRRQQQHDKVLEQLATLDNSVKRKVLLIFPFTYSVDKDDTYIDDLKVQIRESGFESCIFESLLSNEDLARLRIATDIFINAQTTDAFSGSICEVLYAGGKLINPRWLHYSELDKYDLEYAEYSEFEDIPTLIWKTIDEYDRTNIAEHNRASIKELRSVERCRLNWISYFSEIIK